ncbi:hypothetical protein [Deinococcus hopiensis]|uniref:Uncharacterized protein n=1 Tax=Deinococcus hopiensis KR-140 TaxID=695939 RepID=A0A1W1VCM8_9DEIO|nr:hypothetical protein [Deinococcus hopiensis]SMB91128.1 hypothetical protein SAMN00790413_00998 [Deinococcus hopiensis KR-140]
METKKEALVSWLCVGIGMSISLSNVLDSVVLGSSLGIVLALTAGTLAGRNLR